MENINQYEVTCKDGTKDVSNGSILPCGGHGGVNEGKPNLNMVKMKTPTQATTQSDFQYYTSSKFLKRASVVIVPVGLIGYYCYNKKFSLLKSALLVSIPIVAITGLQYLFMGGGKNTYWGIFTPPSIRVNQLKKIQLIEQETGKPQKM
jgi:hypothetical protein